MEKYSQEDFGQHHMDPKLQKPPKVAALSSVGLAL